LFLDTLKGQLLLGCSVHIPENNHLPGEFFFAENQHKSGAEFSGTSHLRLEAFCGIFHFNPQALALQGGHEQKGPIAGRLTHSGQKQGESLFGQLVGVFHQHQSFNAHGETDAGQGRSAEVRDQAIVAAAGGDGVLRTETGAPCAR